MRTAAPIHRGRSNGVAGQPGSGAATPRRTHGFDPTPQTPLGLTARVAPSWGGQADSGTQALWSQETMAGMSQGGVASGSRLDAELGYGLPVGRRLLGTPRVGLGASETGRAYRLGMA